MAFTNPYDEAVPPVGEDARNGYLRIQETKKGIRERINVEHETGSSGTGEWRHKFPKGNRISRDAVTGVVDGWVWFRTDVNAIQMKDATHTSGWRTFYGAIVGEVKMYQGSTATIPAGWKLSDGGLYNGFQTADLREKFIVGTKPGGGGDYDTTNPVAAPKTGGLVGITIRNSDIVEAALTTSPGSPHNHTYSIVSPGGGLQGGSGFGQFGAVTGDESAHTHPFKIGVPVASQTKAENRPPYFALAFIVFVGLGATD